MIATVLCLFRVEGLGTSINEEAVEMTASDEKRADRKSERIIFGSSDQCIQGLKRTPFYPVIKMREMKMRFANGQQGLFENDG